MTGVPESAAAVAHRMRAWQEGHLSGVDSAVILGAVRDAVNEASESLRAVREWCDAQKPCAIGKGCVRCALRAEVVKEVRSLLPSVEAAGAVDQ